MLPDHGALAVGITVQELLCAPVGISTRTMVAYHQIWALRGRRTRARAYESKIPFLTCFETTPRANGFVPPSDDIEHAPPRRDSRRLRREGTLAAFPELCINYSIASAV